MATTSTKNPPVTVTIITDSQFTIKWEKSKDLHYQVFLKEYPSEKDWQRKLNRKNVGSTTVKNLKAGTQYVFKVRASDDSGKVIWEYGSSAKTKELVTKKPESKNDSTLKVTTATGYFLDFNWKKMEDENVRYNAYLKESKDKEWKMIADRCTDMDSIGSGGLKADTQYDFYYEIIDEKGKVLRHEECTARTSDKVLKVSNVTSGGFTIGWEPLADKNVTDYGVYLAGEGPGTAWCKKMKGIKSYTYTGLKPGIRYTTLVFAYGPDGKEVFTYEAADEVYIPFPADAKSIVIKPGITSCNGVYGEGAVGLDVNLGSQFNRKCFEISFDYFISATDKDSARNGNIITFDSSYRALGLIMKDGSIFVTTNNISKYFDAGIRYKKEKWEHINLILIDGDLVINSKLIKVGDITWSHSNNILSSRNFGNGQAFKGQFRNLVVKTKSTLSIFDKKENIICDGTYNPTSIGQSSGKALNMNLGDQFNRNNFEMSFEFYPEAMSGRNDNILTLDTSYRSFGLIMLNDNICVTTNNQRNRFNTDIQVTCNAWNSVNLVYDDGHLTINGKSFQIGNLSEGRNNVISSMNFSNGHAFKGQFRNLVVKTKPSSTH